MSYQFYKIMHLIGLIILFSGLGGLLLLAYAKVELKKHVKIMAYASHGVGLLLILVAGFGMAARLGLTQGFPGWLQAKIAIWALLGVAVSLIKRKGSIGWPIAILIWGLGSSAVIIAINKPF